MSVIRRLFYLVLLLPSVLLMAQGVLRRLPEATLTVQVVDENNLPVEGAAVRIYFEGGENMSKDGLSDKNGVFTAGGQTSGVVFYTAQKSGFYDNLPVRFDFTHERATYPWIPYNPVCKLVIKHIIEPVPMYVRKILLSVPQENVPLGFDFEAGDWVAPYGKGRVSDCAFLVKRRWKNMEDFESSVHLTFPNRLDGIQPFKGDIMRGSVLTSPHVAPASGYDKDWMRETSASPSTGRKNWGGVRSQNFIFRVRAVGDDEGNLKQANYGKIYGDITYGGEASDKMEIAFTYYFNPAVNSRSLEFDTSRNLAGVRIIKP